MLAMPARVTMSFLTRQMIWGLAMVAIGVALAALAMLDVLPFGYTATWFGCLFWQVMTGPWYKHPAAQYTHPIKKKHLLSKTCTKVNTLSSCPEPSC
jgi:hypothetical protein